ncbi:MAG: beta-lactamase family protein, partial [Burkholderiales bacterium]|nr:beta-lactamase family protein [Burkholderiales bacterium]
EGEQLARARFCARAVTPPADQAAFEIGSVSKTMAAFLVADLIEHRGWTLDDPIARHLPEGTRVPRFEDQEIRIRHLVSHTAGLPRLPPGMVPKDVSNPYADLSEAGLLSALADTRLDRAPGSTAAYSNFGMMVLSLAVARAHGNDLETALRTRLFDPLGMRQASIRPRDGAVWWQGHTPDGRLAPAWTIATNLAGVGMVRASLDDMVAYLQAQMGVTHTPLAGPIKCTQQPVAAGFGMNWSLPVVRGRALVLHEGGTGGFSSLVAFDPAARKGVVMLADTTLAELGGLADAALPLLVDLPVGTPRRAMPTPPDLLKALPGEYELAAMNLRLRLWAEDGQLKAQAQGQAAQTLGYDSRGDFYPLAASYLLRPVPGEGQAGQVNRLLLRQGGGVIEAVRAGIDTRPSANNPAWQAFAGEYALTPQFSIRVFEEAGQLKVQGTGQRSISAEQTGPDRIEVRHVGAVIEFHRNDAGAVVRATLIQGGQSLSGAKKP